MVVIGRTKSTKRTGGGPRPRRKTAGNPDTVGSRGDIIRTKTLEEIWAVLNRSGAPAAEAKLREYLEVLYGEKIRHFAVDDPRAETVRLQSTFDYSCYGPPPWFEAPYVILNLTIKTSSDKYMTHGGEELLYNLPGSQALRYEFFWPKDSVPPWHQEVDKHLAIDVQPGELARVNCCIPHLNGPAAAGVVNAWIILRPTSGSPATLLYHPHPHGKDGETDQRASKAAPRKQQKPEKQGQDRMIRTFTKPELEKLLPAQYMMLASGLLERLRVDRLRSERTVEHLAKDSGLNKFYVARLERLELENLPIKTLSEISRQIYVDVVEFLASLKWVCAVKSIASTGTNPLTTVEKPKELGRHSLHPSILRLPQGVTQQIEFSGSMTDIASLIVLRGSMLPIMNIDQDVGRVGQGHVFHAREDVGLSVHAVTDLEVLLIRCSDKCTCGEPHEAAKSAAQIASKEDVERRNQ